MNGVEWSSLSVVIGPLVNRTAPVSLEVEHSKTAEAVIGTPTGSGLNTNKSIGKHVQTNNRDIRASFEFNSNHSCMRRSQRSTHDRFIV